MDQASEACCGIFHANKKLIHFQQAFYFYAWAFVRGWGLKTVEDVLCMR